MPEPSGVRVEIFEQVYHLRVASAEDAAQVTRAAEYVDAKMRAVAANTRDVDSQRLAVLAAIHVADEYIALQAKYDELRAAVDQKSAALGSLLDLELRNAS
jgi:cell division protein ZapA